MPLDRNRLVQLLNQLGDEKDDAALAAARDASALVGASGQSWGELIGPERAAQAAPAAHTASAGAGEKSSDTKLVERLLVRHDLSDTLRGDLEDFRRQLASGKLDQMDSDYLRALAKRLGA
jgi:hypothetical protein